MSGPRVEGVKISLGFCRDNFDLNKNAIIENKKKDFWVLDLFDGECTTSKFPGYQKYIDAQNHFKVGDTVGCMINLEDGTISYFKNGLNLGIAFEEDPKIF